MSLVHVMESDVLDKLSDEYLSETAHLDYRLVVGEAILKVAQELGKQCSTQLRITPKLSY